MCRVRVDVIKENTEVFSGLSLRVVPLPQWDRGSVVPMQVAYCQRGDCVAVSVFLSPVNLDRSKLGGSNLHAEDNAERRDHIGFSLKTSAGCADREQVIRVGGVLRGANNMVRAPGGKRMHCSGRERCKKDVKKSVPIAGGGDIPLAGADNSVKTPQILLGGGEGECFGAPTAQSLPGQWSTYNSATKGVVGDEE